MKHEIITNLRHTIFYSNTINKNTMKKTIFIAAVALATATFFSCGGNKQSDAAKEMNSILKDADKGIKKAGKDIEKTSKKMDEKIKE